MSETASFTTLKRFATSETTTTVDYAKWIQDAADAGDVETMMIAMRANGEQGVPSCRYNLPMARQKQIARMTVAGARRLAAKW